MPKRIDLTGQHFGKLTVLYPGKGIIDSKKRTTWICQCDCGNTIEVMTQSLRSGHTKSCGCLQKEIAKITMQKNRLNNNLDMSNTIFNYIQPLAPTEKRDNYKRVIWKCKCLYPGCGEEFEISVASIPHSLACPKHKNLSKGEIKIKEILLQNNINFIQEYSPVGCINPKTGRTLRFDFFLPDYNLLIEFDGIQHFEKQNYFTSSLEEYQYRDNIKNIWAKENNIRLKRIPYYNLNNLSLDTLLSF